MKLKGFHLSSRSWNAEIQKSLDPDVSSASCVESINLPII